MVSVGTSSMGFHLCSDGSGANTVINVNGGFRHWPDNAQKLDFSKNANKGDDVLLLLYHVVRRVLKLF